MIVSRHARPIKRPRITGPRCEPSGKGVMNALSQNDNDAITIFTVMMFPSNTHIRVKSADGTKLASTTVGDPRLGISPSALARGRQAEYLDITEPSKRCIVYNMDYVNEAFRRKWAKLSVDLRARVLDFALPSVEIGPFYDTWSLQANMRPYSFWFHLAFYGMDFAGHSNRTVSGEKKATASKEVVVKNRGVLYGPLVKRGGVVSQQSNPVVMDRLANVLNPGVTNRMILDVLDATNRSMIRYPCPHWSSAVRDLTTPVHFLRPDVEALRSLPEKFPALKRLRLACILDLFLDGGYVKQGSTARKSPSLAPDFRQVIEDRLEDERIPLLGVKGSIGFHLDRVGDEFYKQESHNLIWLRAKLYALFDFWELDDASPITTFLGKPRPFWLLREGAFSH